MKKLIAVLLALVLCLSLGAGFAETAGSEESAGMEIFLAMMKQIPGMEDVDWEGFAKDFAAKQASGAEITLEDCLPAEAWAAFGALMGSASEQGEDSGITYEIKVTGNDMASIYKMKEQVDEATAKQIAESVAASFETPEALQTMKTSIEQMAGAGIDISKVSMTLKFVNADDSVIYEKTITYDEVKDLEAKPAA